jgi:hypothetical protein
VDENHEFPETPRTSLSIGSVTAQRTFPNTQAIYNVILKAQHEAAVERLIEP